MAQTDVASPLPDMTLREGTTITVSAGTAGAVVTALVVHGLQIIPDTAGQRTPVLIPGR
jgi:hypothetical protein